MIEYADFVNQKINSSEHEPFCPWEASYCSVAYSKYCHLCETAMAAYDIFVRRNKRPMPKNPITLGQLMQYIDCDCESIQIADEDSWDVYSVIPACCTFILKQFADWKVECLAAVGENVIRVGLIEPKEKGEENAELG